MTAPIWITPAGNIGSIVENNNFTYNLEASGTTPITFYVVSGFLPPGLALDPNTGIISGFIPILSQETATLLTINIGAINSSVTVGSIESIQGGSSSVSTSNNGGLLYTFTIRAMNASGISERTFNIGISDAPMTWNVPDILGIFLQNSFINVHLSVSDPGFQGNVVYSLNGIPVEDQSPSGGELPAGLTLNSNGWLSGYVGNIVDQPAYYDFMGNLVAPFPNTFIFSVKAVGSSTITQTFYLYLTNTGDVTPQWNTIGAYNLSSSQGVEGGDIGNIQNGVPYSFQLLSDLPYPGNPNPITYSLIAGILPPGITLSSSGLLSGTLASQAVGIVPLTIQCTDQIKTSSRIFYLRTNFVEDDLIYWLIDKSLLPVDLSTIAPGTSEQFLYENKTFKIAKSLYNTTFDQLVLDNIINNYNLSITETLFVVEPEAGVYNINSHISGNVYDTSILTFIAPVNGEFIFNLGYISVGQTSAFRVAAVTLQYWVRYKIISGALPLGLYLDETSGQIQGQVAEQTPGTYTFQISAYNYTSTQNLSFSIVVNETISYGDNKLTIRLPDHTKIKWLELNNLDLIPSNTIFRGSDANFGKQVKPEIVLLSDVTTSSADNVYNTLSKEIATKLTPSSFISTPVVDNNGVVICESIVLRWNDAFKGTTDSYPIPQEKNLFFSTITLYPGGLDAMRNIMVANGYAIETFEKWMNFYFSTNISNNVFNIVGFSPNFIVGDKINFSNQTLPVPFENAVDYFVIPVSSSTFSLAVSYSDALAGNYISFNINETVNAYGTFQYYFPGTPIAYTETGTATAIVQEYNTKINNTPFGYYTLSSSNNISDVFFGTNYGHDMNTGDRVIFTEDFIPKPFIFDYIYYVIKVDGITFKLAQSYNDAILGNAITISNIYSDQTGKPYSGSFKKVLGSVNNTVQVSEADLRFDVTVDNVFLDNHFNQSPFTGSSITNIITLSNHGLETGLPLQFESQTLTPELSNFVLYYAIVVDNNNFKLATSAYNAFNNTFISFSENFLGFLNLDTATMIPLNTLSQFKFYAYTDDSIFISSQVSKLELGDIITFQSAYDYNFFPPEVSVSTPYYVIPISNNVFKIAASLTDAQNNTFITFDWNFDGYMILNTNTSEFNILQRQ